MAETPHLCPGRLAVSTLVVAKAAVTSWTSEFSNWSSDLSGEGEKKQGIAVVRETARVDSVCVCVCVLA